ncbi:TfoX/Sxy family protein [Pulveribacter suum]|uniref:Competence protein TfoX n=1 Tax=Pulveribacter suum TaxID=2116657 RepID=A0A2P1NLN2_9BURK|nr:TfoX/Sxy family protein [Pulveribacter suum]AVP57930.1 competence protein TfoX [Pulveribacter suum]
MPAHPLPDGTLQLIDAVRAALAERLGAQDMVDERPLFGCHAFMVNGKLCLGVKGEALLVRLPPAHHAATAEQPGVRELDARGGMPGYFWIDPVGYATQAQWRHWLDATLAFNPLARASPPRRRSPLPKPATPSAEPL